MKITARPLFACWMLFVVSLAAAPRIDVAAHGAVGDGQTKDTAALQKAIDACAAAGGGEVVLSRGVFLSGSLVLKSGVTLVVRPEATLLGSRDLADYANGKLISAVDARDVGLAGGGVIDGQGESFWIRKPGPSPVRPAWQGTAQSEYQALKRPSFIHFLRCTNVQVRGLRLVNSPSWTVHFQRCVNVRASGVTLRTALYGPNTDGFDVNSCVDVRIEDCDIVTGDDGIVLKSTEPGPGHPSRDITVANCRIWSACNGLKIGTETHDVFENITFRNCHLYSSLDNPLNRTLAGVAIESVDGSRLSNIRVSDITMDGVKAPLFIRLGHRGGNSPRTRQVEPRVPGSIEGVMIENIRVRHAMFESSITGIPGHPVRKITLTNLAFEYEGGGSRGLMESEVPEEPVIARYPEAQMFGRLPAYGLYCRHVEGLRITGLRGSWLRRDERPLLVFDDVRGARIEESGPSVAVGAGPALWFLRSRDIVARRMHIPEDTQMFIAAEGNPDDLRSIVLEESATQNARTPLLALAPGALLRTELPVFPETRPGVIDIVAAAMRLTAPMIVVPDASLPTGRYVVAPVGSGRDVGLARCRFVVTSPGEYHILVHAYAASGEEDSFYAAVDGGAQSISDLLKHGKWEWDHVRHRVGEKTVAEAWTVYPLTAGEHTLLIRSRESGARIDRIAIVRKGVPFTPSPAP